MKQIFVLLILGISFQTAQGGLTESQFQDTLALVHEMYEPLTEQQGYKLIGRYEWEAIDHTHLADRPYNTVTQGKHWVVRISGAFARTPYASQESLALLACHEMGHHFGGMPRRRGAPPGTYRWESNEGQADYYAASTCLKQALRHLPPSEASATLDPVLVNSFKKFCSGKEASCVDVMIAGWQLAGYFAWAYDHPQPQLGRELESVDFIYDNHSPPQCRWESFKAGALCELKEKSLEPNNCRRVDGREEGARPRCWFAP